MSFLYVVILLTLISSVVCDLPSPPAPTAEECSAFEDNDRFDCYPEPDATQEACESRGCCWSMPSTKAMGVPLCFYPNNYGGLQIVNISDTEVGRTVYVQRTYKSAYPNDVPLFKVEFKFETAQRFRIKISDPNNKRFEPPIPVVPVVDTAAADTDYELVLDESNFGFKVVRKSNEDVVLNAQGVGAFIFADQFVQLSAILPSKYIYGIGEHRSSLLLPTEWSKFTLFNRDQSPADNTNLYGSHPFFLQVENSGNAYGLFLLNSNAMDVVLQPKPAITGRTIGGIYDMYIFLGPTPDDVISQYTEVIGRPILPPYWSLGYHQCRWGYGSLNATKSAWQRTRDAGIPFDVQWNDIDYMQDRNDFTFDSVNYAGLPDFVDELHEAGMHWVPIIDPGVSGSEPAGTYPPYDRGLELGIFIKNSSGLPWTGQVWNPVSTVFPDFTNPQTADYWSEMLTTMYGLVKFDGLWIDMNEPSNIAETICEDNTLNNPPFLPSVAGGKLFAKTVCMDADQYAGKHYDVHNLYAFSEAIITNGVLASLRNKRPFIISRASFSGHGQYAGHWSGDNYASWEEMSSSIEELLTFNMYGIPLMGADMCGFNGETNEELCQRWMQLGSFYTFSRNHNTIGTKDQDPAAISTAVAESSRKALLIRYSLLPYLYTLFVGSHANGTTVARPLFFEFPFDSQTYSIGYEFLWGNGLLVIPVLEEGKTEVTAYLPKALWYDYYTLGLVSSGEESVTLSAPLDTIPLLLKGGTIIPTQVPNVTTTDSRKNKFGLLVSADENNSARGSLYWDDGDTIGTYEDGSYNWLDFGLQDSQITGTPSYIGYSEPMTLGSVTVLGVGTAVTSVSVNGEDTPFTYDADVKALKIENLSVSLTEDFSVTWT